MKNVLRKSSAGAVLVLFLILISSLGASGQSNDWVSVRNGTIPGDAVPGGAEEDGRVTYVCRVRNGGSYISGKALDGRCFYNSGSRSRGVNRFEVLAGEGYSWRRTSSRDRAVFAGASNDENHYVCRVSDSGGQFPGTLQDGKCFYTRNNRGYSRSSFEILESSGYTVNLLTAASRGDNTAVREALRSGQAIDQRDNNGKTALMLASEKGHTGVVRELLYERASIDLRDEKGNTAAMLASANGRDENLRRLFDAGADIRAMNNDGDTAFTLAAMGGHERLVSEFLSGGAYGFVDFGERELAFRNAASYGRIDVLQVLLNSGVSIESPNSIGQTALMLAAIRKEIDTIRFLLRNEANINSRDMSNYTAFVHGVSTDSEKVLRVFMEEFGFVRPGDPEAETGLRVAARYNKRDSLKYLLEKGVNINGRDPEDGYTALMWAAGEGNEKATEMLVKANADLNAAGARGETALILASANSKRNTLRVLIKAGADLNLRDDAGITALGWAIRNKHSDTRKELQKAKAKQ